jgi:glutamine amidotransferase
MSAALDIALVDYGMGNLASVAKALERVGGRVRLTREPAAVRRAGAVVLPGVGAFRDAAARLEESGLAEAIVARVAAGTPFLGVCLGLQLLFESSGEGGRWQGLGVLGGTVERLQTQLKVPHIGWNALQWRPAAWPAAGAPPAGTAPAPAAAEDVPAGQRAPVAMAAGLPEPAYVYFVHSYCAVPTDASVVAAVAEYGGEIVAAVAQNNIWAVQFHPEKSSHAGLRLLANWVRAAGGE